MKHFGYGEGYKYAHNFEGHVVEQEHLPEPLAGSRFYQPSDHGQEPERAAKLREKTSVAGEKSLDRHPGSADV